MKSMDHAVREEEKCLETPTTLDTKSCDLFLVCGVSAMNKAPRVLLDALALSAAARSSMAMAYHH